MTKYWFRKRRGLFSRDLGWGWTPVSWEGYLMCVIVIGMIVFLGFYFDLSNANLKEGFSFLLVLMVILIAASYISDKKTKPSG